MKRISENAKLVVATFAVISGAACGGSPSAPPAAPEGAPAAPEAAAPKQATANEPAEDLKPPGEAGIGDKTKCPVSGEVFTVTDASPHTEVDGKTYFFCCPGCKEKFENDPKKFLEAS